MQIALIIVISASVSLLTAHIYIRICLGKYTDKIDALQTDFLKNVKRITVEAVKSTNKQQ